MAGTVHSQVLNPHRVRLVGALSGAKCWPTPRFSIWCSAAPPNGRRWLTLNARLTYDLLVRGASNPEGKLELPLETEADPEASRVVAFLVEQGWLEKDGGDGAWTVTPTGRFWLESLDYGDVVTFHEYGGAVFLLNTRSSVAETIVWHKGRFATISITHMPQPEHFEVRKENEPVTTSGGFHMEDALATACALVAEDLDVPQPPKPEELRLHMLRYMERS